MNTPLNDDTQQKARDLARKITVAHDLDPEIQEELYGHIEDKLLAYKRGEERILDEDAFILVREHFGDAKVIRGLMQDVHADAVEASLARRLLALAIATSGFYVISGVTSAIIRETAARTLISDGAQISLLKWWLVSNWDIPILFLGLCYLLYRWKHSTQTSGVPWYCRWSISRMVSATLLLGAMRWAMPYVAGPNGNLVAVSPYEPIVIGFGNNVPLIGLCALWLWWSEAGTFRFRHVMVINVVWAMLTVLLEWYPAKLLVMLGLSGPMTDGSVWHLGNSNLGSLLELGWQPVLVVSAQFVSYAVGAFLCSRLYWAFYRQWHRSNARPDFPGIQS